MKRSGSSLAKQVIEPHSSYKTQKESDYLAVITDKETYFWQVFSFSPDYFPIAIVVSAVLITKGR